jgi:hypothetical protein
MQTFMYAGFFMVSKDIGDVTVRRWRMPGSVGGGAKGTGMYFMMCKLHESQLRSEMRSTMDVNLMLFLPF